eukprot:Awhi_evm1s10009
MPIILKGGNISDSFKDGIITPIYKKKGNKFNLKYWRPMTVLDVDYKLVNLILTSRLSDILPKPARIYIYDYTGHVPPTYCDDLIAITEDTGQSNSLFIWLQEFGQNFSGMTLNLEKTLLLHNDDTFPDVPLLLKKNIVNFTIKCVKYLGIF